MATTSSTPLSGTDLLGMPYDITGKYANAESVNLSATLFDFPSNQGERSQTIQDRSYTYPADRCAVAVLNDSNQLYTEYEDARTASQRYSFGVSAQYRTAMFSGSVRAGFSLAYASSAYMKSVAQRSIVRTYSLSLPYTVSQLQEMLTKDADAAINGSMDAAKVIDTYGTHVLAKAVFGGLNEYSQSVSSLNNRTNQAAEVALGANYMRYEGKANGSVSADQIASVSQSNGVMQVFGGDPVTLTSTYEAWAESLNHGNWVMVDFPHDPTALIPLASLARSKARQDELTNAMNDKLQKAGSPLDQICGLQWDKTREKTLYAKGSGGVVKLRVASENQVIVGYGASVTDNKISRAVLHVLDLSTNATFDIWANSDHRIEKDVNVPLSKQDAYGNHLCGVAVVGVGAVASNNDMTGITLWYEELDPANSVGSRSMAFPPANIAETRKVPGSAPTYLSGDRQVLVAGSNALEASYQADPGWIVTEIGLGMGGSDDNVNVMQISTAPLVQTVQCRIRCVNSTQATVQHWTLASPYVMAGWNNQGEIVEGEVAPQGWEIVTFTLPPVDVFEFSVEISVTVGNQMVTGILTYLPYVEQPWAFITQTPLIELTDQVLQCAFVFCSLEGM